MKIFFLKNIEVKYLSYKFAFYIIGNRFPVPIKNPRVNCFCNLGIWNMKYLSNYQMLHNPGKNISRLFKF